MDARQRQRLDQFTQAEITEAEAEISGLIATRTTASRADLLRGTRVVPGGGSDLLRLYIAAVRRGRSRRRHFGPTPDPADTFKLDRKLRIR